MPLCSAGERVGENISAPLTWSGVPPKTVELAIILENPDAPLPRPFVHMIAYRIAPDRSCFTRREHSLSEARDMACGKSTAGAMIRANNTPLTEVASAVRYRSESSVRRVFRRETGVAPREYRRTCTVENSRIRPSHTSPSPGHRSRDAGPQKGSFARIHLHIRPYDGEPRF